jgi:hypothetical protein
MEWPRFVEGGLNEEIPAWFSPGRTLENLFLANIGKYDTAAVYTCA